ncbi:MAG: hypothetical protein NVSMB24_14750 [Mucilaginibacter sp.]
MDVRLVSIALCTYNGAKHLTAQLDTLIAQTYKQLEIIVVDDCSTDDTYAILTEYANRFPQIKIFRNESNLGFTANFEKAAALCTGELIALCDQDDLWHPQKIELQVNALKNNILIYHDSEFIHEDGTSMNKKMSDLMNLYRGDRPEAFLFFNCVSGHSILMKKQLISAAFPLKKDYFHDWWLAYVATNIGEIDYIPQCLVQYRQHDKSETNILQLPREQDKYKFSKFDDFQRTLNWLSYCASYKGSKDQILIEQFYYAFKARLDSYVSFKLGTLLFKHWKTVFYMRKKPALSKLNYIRKQIWGGKTKKLFDSK